MKFAVGITALLATGAAAFAPAQASGRSSSLSSTAEATPTYTFTKSEEIFAEAQEVRKWRYATDVAEKWQFSQ